MDGWATLRYSDAVAVCVAECITVRVAVRIAVRVAVRVAVRGELRMDGCAILRYSEAVAQRTRNLRDLSLLMAAMSFSPCRACVREKWWVCENAR